MAMQAWEKAMRANVRKLTPEQARAVIDAVNAQGITIFQPEISKLTGGLNSQNINFATMRELGRRAWMIRNGVKPNPLTSGEKNDDQP